MIVSFVALSGLAIAELAAIGTPAPSLDIRPHEASAECGTSDMQIEVVVNNVTPVGILTVELYTPSKRDFLRKESRVHRIRVPAEEGSQTVCFDVPEPGRYALAAYHDKDADRDLDQKWNRMPAEPFALSSNKKLEFGFPKFEDSAFTVGEDGKRVVMDLRE